MRDHGLYVEFRPPRPLAGYVGMNGSEVNGMALPYSVLDSRAGTLPHGFPDEYIVTGMDIAPNGRRYLRFTVNPAHIERVTDVRYVYPSGRVHPPRAPRSDAKGKYTEALPAPTARPILDARKPPPIEAEPIPEDQA